MIPRFPASQFRRMLCAGLVLLAAAGVMTACTQTNTESIVSGVAEPEAASAVTIVLDEGGRLANYALRVAEMKEQRQLVRFAGRCNSACTLHLSMSPDLTCIMPGASFGFHAPYGASVRGNRLAADYMMRSYPEWVRAWLAERGGLTRSTKTMSYQYARLYLPPCAVRYAGVAAS